MKPGELRLGNFIKDSNNSEIIDLVVELDLFAAISLELCSLDDLTPIPLTEEWLERFGFEEVNKGLTFKKGLFELEKAPDCFQYETTNIYYVHQLQNLYSALTGEELTIKNA